MSVSARSVTGAVRDVLSPREVSDRTGFSYHAILRAIRRGDLHAYEPVPGHYRIELREYERWLHRPARGNTVPAEPGRRPRRSTARTGAADPGSFARLRAIEQNT